MQRTLVQGHSYPCFARRSLCLVADLADAQTALSFRFKILGRHEARLRGNEPAITVACLSGRGDHLVYCGTLTLAESEWEVLSSSLRAALGDAVEIAG